MPPHGRLPASPEQGPLLISARPELLETPAVAAAGVRDLLLRHLDLPVETVRRVLSGQQVG